MTRPVVVFHNITKETSLGNYENQTMCFYLPQKYQEHDQEGENHQQTKPAPRHAAATPPTPMNDRVFILTRPRMEVFVRRFGGFALTHDSWERQKEILEEDIIGQKYNPSEYFTASYNNPWQLANRRNEVWLQSFQSFQTLPAGQHDNKGRTSGHHTQKGGQQKTQPKFKRVQKNPGKPRPMMTCSAHGRRRSVWDLKLNGSGFWECLPGSKCVDEQGLTMPNQADRGDVLKRYKEKLMLDQKMASHVAAAQEQAARMLKLNSEAGKGPVPPLPQMPSFPR